MGRGLCRLQRIRGAVQTLEALARSCAAGQTQAPRLAFVFGSERYGLTNEDVYRAHVCLSIPTNPAYGSLNLAQAIQLLAYEYRQALGSFEVQARTPPPRWADAAAVHGALQHWQSVLQHIGFLDPAAPKKLMPRLQQLLNRVALTPEEVHILRGIARAIEQAAPARPHKATTPAPDWPSRTTLE